MATNEINEKSLPNEVGTPEEKALVASARSRENERTVEKPEGQGAGEIKTPLERPLDSKKSFALPSLRRPKKAIPQVQDEVTLKIERVLEEGLSDSFQRLSPIAQQEFKIKGEETAIKIRELLSSTHVKVKKVLAYILEWLKLLPGVNRFFLEQEAKIKADRILQIMERKEKE